MIKMEQYKDIISFFCSNGSACGFVAGGGEFYLTIQESGSCIRATSIQINFKQNNSISCLTFIIIFAQPSGH